VQERESRQTGCGSKNSWLGFGLRLSDTGRGGGADGCAYHGVLREEESLAAQSGHVPATMSGKTITIKTLRSGAIERVYYGTQRIGAKGEISEGGIEEQHDGASRMLLIYDWQGHAYVCLENVGELDMLDAAEGTCPYEIIAMTQGNYTGGNEMQIPENLDNIPWLAAGYRELLKGVGRYGSVGAKGQYVSVYDTEGHVRNNPRILEYFHCDEVARQDGAHFAVLGLRQLAHAPERCRRHA
jgi:hypothetical protein